MLQGPSATMTVDLLDLPFAPTISAAIGETWHFQAWYRGGSSSRLTNTVSVSVG